jgi:hypothetical protein
LMRTNGIGQTPICSHRHPSTVGGRHDLHPHVAGFPVFGRRHRRVQQESGGLGVCSSPELPIWW